MEVKMLSRVSFVLFLTFLILLSTCFAGEGYQFGDYKSLGFIAPQVKGRSNVDEPDKGEIVFDATAGSFYGYNGTTWSILDSDGASDTVVKTPGATNPVMYSAFVTDGSSSTSVSREYSNWINGNCTNSATGVYVCTLETGAFSATPNCVGTVSALVALFARVTSDSATQVTIRIYNYVGGLEDGDFSLICHGLK